MSSGARRWSVKVPPRQVRSAAAHFIEAPRETSGLRPFSRLRAGAARREWASRALPGRPGAGSAPSADKLPVRPGAGYSAARMRLPGTLLVALVLVACGGQLPASPVANAAPRARLAGPLLAPLGVKVVFDAADSFDPDGRVLEYTFSFSDGARPVTQSTPDVEHVFEQPGAYEVVVVVRDDTGQLAGARQLVVVRTDPPLCTATPDCQLGAECRFSLCYTTETGPGAGVVDCQADPDCGTGLLCRAGLCLTAGAAPTP